LTLIAQSQLQIRGWVSMRFRQHETVLKFEGPTSDLDHFYLAFPEANLDFAHNIRIRSPFSYLSQSLPSPLQGRADPKPTRTHRRQPPYQSVFPSCRQSSPQHPDRLVFRRPVRPKPISCRCDIALPTGRLDSVKLSLKHVPPAAIGSSLRASMRGVSRSRSSSPARGGDDLPSEFAVVLDRGVVNRRQHMRGQAHHSPRTGRTSRPPKNAFLKNRKSFYLTVAHLSSAVSGATATATSTEQPRRGTPGVNPPSAWADQGERTDRGWHGEASRGARA
jgi:hypothetical protein